MNRPDGVWFGRKWPPRFQRTGVSIRSRTRFITLSPASIESNARYWGSKDAVPRQGMALGLKTFSSTQQTLLLVSGEKKDKILNKVLTLPIVSNYPATVLRTFDHVTVIADQESACLLQGVEGQPIKL